MQELLRKADRFQAGGLYEHCLAEFGRALTVETAIQQLVWAHAHAPEGARAVVMEYVVAHCRAIRGGGVRRCLFGACASCVSRCVEGVSWLAMPGCALTCNANGRRRSPGTRCLYCLHYRPMWWGSSLLILEPFWALSYHRCGGAAYLHIGGKANSPSCPHKHPSSILLLCPLAQTKKAVLRQCPMIPHYGLPLAPLNYVRTLNSP